jgi:hypothetical protein
MDDGTKLLIMCLCLSYLCLGIFRNALKERILYNQGKLSASNDSIAFLKYTSKNLSFGDLLFFPTQIFMVSIIVAVIGLIRVFSFLLK